MSLPIKDIGFKDGTADWPLVYFPHEDEYPKSLHMWTVCTHEVLIYYHETFVSTKRSRLGWMWGIGYCDLDSKDWFLVVPKREGQQRHADNRVRVYCWIEMPPDLNKEEHAMFDYIQDF